MPIDPKAAELLSKAPGNLMDFENGKTPEDLGLQADPTKPPTQFPSASQRGRLVVFFAQEHFRGEDRILLDKGGSLPAMRLPDEHGAEDFLEAHALEIFCSPVINCGQIGSVSGENMDMYVVTGDVLHPAGCLQRLRTPKQYRWTPRSEIVRFRTIQSVIIALAQTRVFGWHIQDKGGREFVLSFDMVQSPIMTPRVGNPAVISTGPALEPESHGTRFAVHPDIHDREEYPDPCGPSPDAKN